MLTEKNLYFYLYGVVLVALCALIIFLSTLEQIQMIRITQEGGIIETLTVTGYFACLLAILTGNLQKLSAFTSNWSAMLALLAFALRELDFHTRFTTISVTKIAFYTHPEVHPTEKVVAFSLIALIACALWNLATRHLSCFTSLLKQREPYAVGIFWGLVLLVFSKTLDGAQRKLDDFGVFLSRDALTFLGTIEECSELFIPLMFLISISVFYKAKR